MSHASHSFIASTVTFLLFATIMFSGSATQFAPSVPSFASPASVPAAAPMPARPIASTATPAIPTFSPTPVPAAAPMPSRPIATTAESDDPSTPVNPAPFYICHQTESPLLPNHKYFLRMKNEEPHSIYIQFFTRSEGEEIYRLHPGASFERWIDTPANNAANKISVATRVGEECGNVRLTLWDYDAYLQTMLGIFVFSLVLLATVCMLCGVCVCLVRKARKNALEMHAEPTRYQKMHGDGRYVQHAGVSATQFPGVIVATDDSDEEVIPFSSLNTAIHAEDLTKDTPQSSTSGSVSSITALSSPPSVNTKRDSLGSKRSQEHDSIEY